MLWWLHRLAEDHKGDFCGYLDMGRTQRRLNGWTEARQGVVVATGVGIGSKECCDGYIFNLRTIRLLWWLHVLTEDHRVAFLAAMLD